MRVVLDTNVWLDWLVFEDPEIIPLKRAREKNAVDIVINASCRDELVRVLAYPKFELDDRTQADIIRQVDQLSRQPEKPDYPSADRLPYCSDPDDVKFQSLAYASNADWLITKDNALLSERRNRKPFSVSYEVVTPKQWGMLQFDFKAPLK